MAYDAYSLCPGGTGKKIKFCCPELLGELDKLERMVTGQQYQAAWEHVERLDKKHPNRACLMSAKAQVALILERTEEAEQTAQALVTQQPDNPVALALAAQAAFETTGAMAGLPLLQRAIEVCREQMYSAVVETMAVASEQLLAEGLVPAGRRHVVLLLTYSPRDEQMTRILQQIDSSSVHPLFKVSLVPPAAPEGAPWQAEFDDARRDIIRGAWRRAAATLGALLERHSDEAPLWRALAAARIGLADDVATADALHRYAQLAPEEPDAVQAEALAQVLEEVERGDTVDTVVATREVTDTEQVLARLAAHPLAVAVQVDRHAADDVPPPRAAFALLDRPHLESGEGLELDQIPRILGRVLVYGRETDRQARLEVVARRPLLESVHTFLADTLGEYVAAPSDPRTIDRETALGDALRREWLLPRDVPVDRQHALLREGRRRTLTEQLPKMAWRALGGLTLEAAAADPARRLAVQGWLLKTELTLTSPTASEEVDELRVRLGLPVPAPLAFNPAQVATRLGWLPRLDVDRADDETLRFAVVEALRTRLASAQQRLLPAALARPALKEDFSSAILYVALSEIQEDSAQALAYVRQAREAAVAAGQSPAHADLAIVRLQLHRGEFEPALQLLQRVAREHPREPGVQQQIAIILSALGYEPGMERSVQQPLEAVAAASPAEPGKIWTPESERGEAKSGLWLPGQD